MSLFGGSASQARSRNLVEFKAGKMNLRGNMVYPDKRKGLLYLYQGNDMLMHLCWKDRSNNSTEDDLVIFPDEIEFKKVTQSTTGRVYILKWRINSRKLFFWMQEPKEDQDEEFCKKINDLLNHPPTPGFGDDISDTHPLQPFMERMAGGAGSGIDPNDLSNVLRNLDPNDFASLLSSSFGRSGRSTGLIQGTQHSGGSSSSSTQHVTDSRPNTAPASTTVTSTTRNSGSSSKPRNGGTSSSSPAAAPKSTASSTASSGSKSGSIQMSALTSVLANLSSNATEATTTTSSSKPVIDLCDIMTNENLVSLLANKDVQEKLRAHLPEDNTIPNTEEELKESIQSPQFRQIVSAFSVALQSGELGPVLIQFGLPDDAIKAANQGDLQAFAQALEKHYKKSHEEKSSDNTMDTS
ncbi:unnamed protein product [Rotaria sordida]|uniref:Proteasomal ubiquitin receptor ADRM1 n=1 Tax=Rotaria sordida TaxID=392033 RepID=A0A818M6E8_9BILA|nr:unnamed protein product [Rotaria sordida]CAF0966049.1 unnamed protein product [Rotaria sordida]CAF3583352.1 unnamed protein product [Rotaria sordida]CAF3733882.1 unnamed protein product [Rotaria sordida]